MECYLHNNDHSRLRYKIVDFGHNVGDSGDSDSAGYSVAEELDAVVGAQHPVEETGMTAGCWAELMLGHLAPHL